ncbi:sulfite exporter TauE/SafE family protein [soil metagenome]
MRGLIPEVITQALQGTSWQAFLILAALGCMGGFLAGLLGIGGGMVLVPFMAMIFSAAAMAPDKILHVAIATSTATIMFTSLSSVRAHHKRGAVLWPVVAVLAPGIVVGALIGAQVASALPTVWLTLGFAIFLAASATQLLLDRKPNGARDLPGRAGMFGAGSAIGFISSLVGAGGGFISVPFMTWCNVNIRQAVATSAALGFPIAAAGAVGYVVAGVRESGPMPPGNLGFINVPALVAVVVTSVFFAPLGARAAHRLPVRSLKRIFGTMLYFLAAYMFYRASIALHAPATPVQS